MYLVSSLDQMANSLLNPFSDSGSLCLFLWKDYNLNPGADFSRFVVPKIKILFFIKSVLAMSTISTGHSSSTVESV